MPIPDNANEPEYWRKRAEDARTKASTTLYNGQFPGPMVRLTEGKRVVVDIYNDTDTHWHGQFVPADVDGAAEEGRPNPGSCSAQTMTSGLPASICSANSELTTFSADSLARMGDSSRVMCGGRVASG